MKICVFPVYLWLFLSLMQILTEIQNQIEAACARVGRNPSEITLVGASKTLLSEPLEEFCAAGLQNFGENYVGEGISKIRNFRDDGFEATWHFIGALQSNKAREAVQNFDWIHSVDRLSLARELDKEARKIGKIQRILIQVNLSDEPNKAGIAPQKLEELAGQIGNLPNLRLEGLMSLPPYDENPENSRPFHRRLRELLSQIPNSNSQILSMGMSRDFEIAIEEGATHVRIGTKLFGAR